MSNRKRAKLIALSFRAVVLDRHLVDMFDFNLLLVLDENGVDPIVWSTEEA